MKRSSLGPRSKFIQEKPVKEFNFTKPIITPQLRQKRLEMEETNNELEDAKNKFEQWKCDFQKKKREIEDKQHKLEMDKENLREFTMHHNYELEKAQQKEHEMMAKIKKIQEDIKDLQQQDEELQEKNNALKAKLDVLQPCADYLNSVVDFSTNFDSIESILNRYHSINLTREEYLDKYRKLLETFGTDSAKRMKLIELRKSYLIDKTKKFIDNINKLKQEKLQSEYGKLSLIKDIQRIEDKSMELAMIKTSIRSIYERAVDKIKGSDSKNISADNLTEEQMLVIIRNRFTDLSDIIKASRSVTIVESN